MDVTKLFERSDDTIEPLELAKLDAMIERAISYPQLQIPANQNPLWVKKAVALAAAVIMAVTVSFQFLPVQELKSDAGQSSVVANDDAYGDVSDLLMMETVNDLTDLNSAT